MEAHDPVPLGKEGCMEFLPHTKEALDEYLTLADPDLESSLMTMGDSAARIVPDCVGLSLTLYDEDDLTFTLVASSLPLAEIDAMQYLDGGPCVTAVEENAERSEDVQDLLDEERWALFARASAAAGVASTLSLPVVDHDRVVGGINLYASSADAFSGHHRDLATALGASAVGAVANADLAFETRRRAEQAPRQLREQRLVEVATGVLAAREGIDVQAARQRLLDAASRAGISEAQAALVLINVHQG
jgi:GAF domain-containing protein